EMSTGAAFRFGRVHAWALMTALGAWPLGAGAQESPSEETQSPPEAPPESDAAPHVDASSGDEPAASEPTPPDDGEPPTARTPESAAAAPSESEPAPPPPPAPVPAEGEEDLTAGLDDLSLVDLLQLDLRVATTKTNTTVQASPAAVTVITRADIERFG